MPIVLKSSSRNLLEPSGPFRTCIGIAVLGGEVEDSKIIFKNGIRGWGFVRSYFFVANFFSFLVFYIIKHDASFPFFKISWLSSHLCHRYKEILQQIFVVVLLPFVHENPFLFHKWRALVNTSLRIGQHSHIPILLPPECFGIYGGSKLLRRQCISLLKSVPLMGSIPPLKPFCSTLPFDE